MRRMLLGISQEKLSRLLGLTFQQVQKYERGINRISAGRLYELAHILRVPVGFFFEGLSPTAQDVTEMDSAESFSLSGQDLQISLAFMRIRDATLRRHLLAMIEALASSQAAK
jgi:transcriptional regulator with XRE-family HTH domain